MPHSTKAEYNGHDSRAFVPTPAMKESEDVMLGTGDGYTAAANLRCPFGVGIYKRVHAASEEEEIKQMPLFYVSEKVSIDRGRSAPGMLPGWYLAVDEVDDLDQEFQIRVSRKSPECDDPMQTVFGRDRAILKVLVQGNACSRKLKVSKLTGADNIFRGFEDFSMSKTCASNGSYTYTSRAFSFGKAEVVQDTLEDRARLPCPVDNEQGFNVEVKIRGATKGKKRERFQPGVAFAHGLSFADLQKKPTATEKGVLKQGTSVGVSCGKSQIQLKGRRSRYHTIDEVSLPHLGVKVHIRGRRWLQMRRVINELGEPCTKAMAVRLAKLGEPELPPRLPKRVKREEATVESVCSEVIQIE